GFINAPLDSGKRGRGVENILPVVQIQNRITSPRKTTVTRRQIDQHVAPISQNFGMKCAMSLNVSGEGVLWFQTETLRMSFRACRGISYYFRMRINFRVRDFSTSPRASLEMTKRK